MDGEKSGCPPEAGTQVVPKRVAVCTSAEDINIRALLAMLRVEYPNVEFVQLPYNDLDEFRLREGIYSCLILGHSINNRRFAITNVTDALYDVFLPHARDVLGKENVCVIVHDFLWPLRGSSPQKQPPSDEEHDMIKEAHMEAFRVRQPTTFECCDMAMICGRLDGDGVEMDERNKKELIEFVNRMRILPTPPDPPAPIIRPPPIPSPYILPTPPDHPAPIIRPPPIPSPYILPIPPLAPTIVFLLFVEILSHGTHH